MDYLTEFNHLRIENGLLFKKGEREIRDAIEERTGEISASIERRRAAVLAFAEREGLVEHVDAVIKRVREMRDPGEIDLFGYDPASAVLIGCIAAMRIEDESIQALRFVSKHVAGESALTYRSLVALFRPYDPYNVDRCISLSAQFRRLERERDTEEPAPARRRKTAGRRRRDDQEVFGVEDFIASPDRF